MFNNALFIFMVSWMQKVVLPFGLQSEVDAHLHAFLDQKNITIPEMPKLNSSESFATDYGNYEKPETVMQNSLARERILRPRSLQLRSKQQQWAVGFFEYSVNYMLLSYLVNMSKFFGRILLKARK